MNYLSTGVDPECDTPAGVFWGEDLDEVNLNRISGLAIGKSTRGLERVSGSKRIKYISTTCWSTDTAEFVQSLPCLKHLHISRVRGAVVDVGEVPSLRILSLFACAGLESLWPFTHCSGIESLWISGCMKFRTLEGLNRYSRLGELEIIGSMTKSGTLESIAEIAKCTSLKYVALATRVKTSDLAPLSKLKQLKYLWLQNRFKLEQYEAILASCPRLAKIDLHNGSFDRVVGFQEDPE